MAYILELHAKNLGIRKAKCYVIETIWSDH